MTIEEILAQLPYEAPFLFVDEILQVDEKGISGAYTYPATSDFYKGHFKNNPLTPGVILTETMAQIGLVAFGIYLLHTSKAGLTNLQIALTSTEIDFFKPVLPGERVVVTSEKVYFRFKKLKCRVALYNAQEELVCRGQIAGMINDQHG